MPKADTLRALGNAPGLGRLTRLDLCFTMPAAPIVGLVDTPLAARLRSLYIIDIVQQQGEALVDVLVAEPRFPALEQLGLNGGNLGNEGLLRLARTPNLPALRELTTGHDRAIGPPGVTGLLGSPLWTRLTSLQLSHCSLTADTVAELVAALPNGQLRELSLNYSGLTGDAIAAFNAAPSWGKLETLSLDGNEPGDEALAALVQSPHLAGLERLDLRGCGVGDATARALAAVGPWNALRRLTLLEHELSPEARQALRQRFGARLHFGYF
jgi:hypothetical protein